MVLSEHPFPLVDKIIRAPSTFQHLSRFTINSLNIWNAFTTNTTPTLNEAELTCSFTWFMYTQLHLNMFGIERI